uniref:Ig-like domain-containing protein n=1 Tax=Serinus canaria TaxID=9135 RepID=A0A8C9MQ45_SERCA
MRHGGGQRGDTGWRGGVTRACPRARGARGGLRHSRLVSCETGQEMGRDWAGTGKELGRKWAGTGEKLGRNWERTGQELGRNWERTVQELGKNWAEIEQKLGRAGVAGRDFPAAAALAAAQVTSEDQEVPEHKPVELRCAAFRSSSGSSRIEWKFQRGSSLALIYYGGELTEPYRDRVQFSPTSIRFQSVTREDSGKYICEVVGDGSQIAKSEVNLIVPGAPGEAPGTRAQLSHGGCPGCAALLRGPGL